MSEQLQIALINLIIRVGLDKAIDILSGIHKVASIDEAITALRETQKKTWDDYKNNT